MRNKLRWVWCALEVLYTRIMMFFGRYKDEAPIPAGPYCYTPDGTTGVHGEDRLPYYGIKTCKYYRYIDGDYTACTFTGFIGWDVCHWDQVKICATKDDIDLI